MSNIREAREALVQQILEGDGEASRTDRQAAFNNRGLREPLGALVNNVAMHACRVTEKDINEVKASGFSEDQIFEIVVCAAIGQAARQYDAALAALDEATGKE